MRRTILLYALALAAGVLALQWLQFANLTHAVPTELYVVLIAAAFAGLGVWIGVRLTPQKLAGPFARNTAALRSLGMTERECAVLELLAAGQSNKEIARSLGVSPNTVKTHVANLFGKLEVQRRTQAIQKGRELSLIP